MNNFTSLFAEHVITYPCRDKSKTMLVKETPGEAAALLIVGPSDGLPLVRRQAITKFKVGVLST